MEPPKSSTSKTPAEDLKRFTKRQQDKRKVVSLHQAREAKQAERQRLNRLAMLMHSFLDAEAAADHDGMKMYGRGISGYTREERQDAYACALNARKATKANDATPTADPTEPDRPEAS